jgi:hypothetical protein
LKAEIKRRGVSIVADESPLGVDAVEGRDLIVIKRLLSLPAALVARSRLESAGIECFMADDNMARIYLPNVVGGVKLLVSPENADAAAAILDESTPEIPDSAGGE